MTTRFVVFCVWIERMPAWRITISLVSHVQVSIASYAVESQTVKPLSNSDTDSLLRGKLDQIIHCSAFDIDFSMHKQSILHSESHRFSLKCDGFIKTSTFPTRISRSNEVRFSFLRGEASSMSINMAQKSCTVQRGRANCLGQTELYDENEDLCPVECVTEFKTDDELLKVLDKAKETNALVVVDFYRPSCGSCKYIEQGFSKLCKQSGDQEAPVIFLKHNVIDEYDEQSEVAERLRIKSVPLFHFYKNGVLLEAFATRDKERIDASINKYTT